jgi:ATP-dependent helicase HrpB
MLLRHGFLESGRVVTLQPRRLAARLLATRVARELGGRLGGEVGYQVRFDNVTSADTRIVFETEGILLRQMIQDPKLPGIRALIFDEFHERHLYGDITLARALEIQESIRPDLLIVVMSATLDTGALESYLSPCTVVSSTGRTFPVSIEYLARHVGQGGPPVWELAADALARSFDAIGGGDALVFMPGSYEIHRTIEALKQRKETRGCVVLPLHGELSPKDQDAAVERYDSRKIVVATNVAETSITIDGVRLVIDSGLARIPRFDPHRGINTLLVERISQASAEQRAGRAGRTAQGHCVRLWSEAEHSQRALREVPEVQRLDLSEVVLTLKASRVEDLTKFRWLESPNPAALQHAEELLLDLGALDGAGPKASAITSIGRRMLAFPLHPRYARMLLAAQEYRCVREACLVAALTQGRDLLLRNPAKSVVDARQDLFADSTDSDFFLWIRAWNHAVSHRFQIEEMQRLGIHGITARQVGPLLEQFLRIARQEGLDTTNSGGDSDALQKCILVGFSDRVGRRIDEGQSRCELVHGRRGTLSRESVVRSMLLVVAEVQEISGKPGDVNTVLSLATAIELEWLRELFPKDLQTETRTTFDSVGMRVRAEEILRFRSLVVSSKRLESPPPDAAATAFVDEIVAGRLQLPKWDHTVTQWIVRLNLLSRWCPELGLHPILEDGRRHILEQLCHGATSYKEIRDRDVKSAVKSWLSPGQWDLIEKHTPERVTLSNGRTPKVTYEPDNPPFIAMRIQELFGVNQIPKIAMGRVGLAVHILAPSMRPVQVTQDLANFWREHYPAIKSQLQRRYPKHEWR